MNDRDLGRIELEPGRPFTLDDARALIEGTRRRESSTLALYRLMRTTGQLAQARVLAYRCRAHGCLLLDVFDTPEGPGAYKPARRYSPSRNEGTSPEARRKRTTDGERRWEESADLLDVDPPAGLGVEYWVSCDHLLDSPVPAERVNADMATRRSEGVILLPDDMP